MSPSSTMESPKPIRVRKRRIPKACGACRQAKAKCDGKRPCTRCKGLKKTCAFTDRPKEAHELRIEELEREVENLRTRLQEPTVAIATAIRHPTHGMKVAGLINAADHAPVVGNSSQSYHEPLYESPAASSLSQRSKKSSFETGSATMIDCIEASLVTLQQAESYFSVFFQGCDHFVPAFDPRHDSFHSIRERSSLLFNAICTIGCRIVTGPDSHQWRVLDFHLKRMLNRALAMPSLACLETVQAFLVRSCYAPERSLLVAAATRMAFDLGLADSYDELIAQSVPSAERHRASAHGVEDAAFLMRRTRTWLHLFVLSHIHHVDAADLPTFKFVGDARRSRIVLKNPFSTELDLFLFAQVELNDIRTRIYDSLSNNATCSDGEIMELVREARIDIDVWFDDWAHIFEKHGAQSPWLMLSLRVQKCWAENMAMCRAVRASGVEDVDLMSSTQREILFIARDALEEHLNIMIEEPRIYLHNLRYAMDFVWAKCTFCYLLLIKLSLLLPDSGRGRSSQELIAHGNIVLAELRQASGGSSHGDQSNTGKLYTQLLKTGIDRFSNTLHGSDNAGNGGPIAPTRRNNSSFFPFDGQSALDSFVPEQFVFEWDFPGLSLFSSGTGMAWLDDVLLGALNGGDEFFGWTPMETGE